MSVIHITEDTFTAEVLNSDKPVLLDFFATWCGPCKMLSPVLDAVAEERPDIKVCKADVDQNADLAKKYRVMSVPTLMVIKNGEIAHRSSGVMTKDQILALL